MLKKRLNQFKKEFLLIVLLLFLGFNCKKQATRPEPEPEHQTLKILFIGSSYFNFNNLPEIFKNLAQAGNKDVTIGRQIRNGVYLEYHSTNQATEDIINQEKWDYVLLQGVCTNCGYPETHQEIFPPYQSHPLKPALEILHQKIKTNCDSTKIVYCMPWAFEDGTQWLNGYNDTYFDMQKKIYDNTLEYANEIGLVVAPVGWAWNEVLKEKINVLHYLHLSDYNHPSKKGSYLTACVIYSTIYQQSLSDVNYYAGLSENEAKKFQSVASSIVLDNLVLWNIVPGTLSIDTK